MGVFYTHFIVLDKFKVFMASSACLTVPGEERNCRTILTASPKLGRVNRNKETSTSFTSRYVVLVVFPG